MEPNVTTPQFPPTRWSVVLSAAGGGEPARVALEELCRLYWLPLYAYARQRGFSPEDAEDETQQFLANAVSDGLLSSALPEKGRLRTYLLAAFQHDLLDAVRRASRQKRGGLIQFVPLDSELAERRAGAVQGGDPSAAFDRAFAVACLEQAGRLLSDEYTARGRQVLFDVLQPFLDPGNEPPHAAAAAAAGLAPNALRQAVFRLRQRYRVLLRQVVADTLSDPSDALIDEELSALLSALTA